MFKKTVQEFLGKLDKLVENNKGILIGTSSF